MHERSVQPYSFFPHMVPAVITRPAIIFSVMVLLFLFFSESPLSAQKETNEREIFMWVGAQKLQQEQPHTLENMLLFARRFDIIPYSSGMNDEDKLKDFLAQCHELGISRTWIEIGPGRDAGIRSFVEDESVRKPVLERMTALAGIYKEYYPDFARITLFDEAPLGAFSRTTTKSDKAYTAMLEEFMMYGPQAFSYLQKAIKQEMPDAAVGIFMHHPHNASETMAGDYSVINRFMMDCREYGGIPDFIFSDVYRGYFTRGYGMEKTNAYIEDVARYTREVAGKYNIKAYQLGQMHTIKLGYTPGKMEIDQNVEAMIRGGIDGMGWYWPNYASTNHTKKAASGSIVSLDYEISHDPFVPNAWGKTGPAGSVYATSHDRFVYSYLRMVEENGSLKSETHFDLWIYGYDFDHTEHKLYLKTNAEHGNRYELAGHFNPQHDKDGYIKGEGEEYIYSCNNKWGTIAFHGLSRKRYLDGDERNVFVKIETTGGSDTSRLNAVYIMPYRMTRNYITEDLISSLIEDSPRWVETNSLGSYVWPSPKLLKPADTLIMKIN